ncbi:MAG TPA: DUF2155 domain-containing protein [Azospirillum sp.]|nr:DUF2155 domain-containing protein [Azospirillum sp.]
MSPGLRAAAAVALLMLSGTAAAAPVPDQMVDRPAVRVQSLDKVTARVSTFDIAVGDTKEFGNLRITLRACKENPPIEPPESAAFLEVVEIKQDLNAQNVFSGWMFASSPALSAMEHPIYDLWVLSCVAK